MIIEIKIANYRSINEEQTISFAAEDAPRLAGNLIPCKGFKLMKAAALFGANASGKSNLVKAIAMIVKFIRISATGMNSGDLIQAAEPYKLTEHTRNNPSRFELVFLLNAQLYRYGFSVRSDRVYEEWLEAENPGAKKLNFGFKRSYNSRDDHYIWEFHGSLKSVGDILKERTRINALALSTGSRENISQLQEIYLYFKNQIWIQSMSNGADGLKSQTAKRCGEYPIMFDKVTNLLRDADTGIDRFRIEHKKMDEIESIDENAPPKVQEFQRAINKLFESTIQQKIIVSRTAENGEEIEFDFDSEESTGTLRLFALAGPILDSMEKGAFIVVDELDSSMHPLLSRKLLELFQSQENNTQGAQLLFTTHDPSLLDQELFRRDQIWIAEKQNGATAFYSLLDIEPKPRNTESFLRNYMAGRYGGTPNFGRSFDTPAMLVEI